MKKIAIALTAVVALGGLTACGGGDDAKSFCNDWKDAGTPSMADASGIKDYVAKLEKIDAPSEISTEWDNLTSALGKVADGDASQAASVTEDLSKITEYASKNCK